MAGFDLGAMLASVSDSDTGREQIEYIPLVDLQSDPNNFYQLSHLDELADNIATCGLQQPLRVRPDPAGGGKYIIVSGHRRRAAVEILAKENEEKWREVPCIVERDSVSPALQQLRLIYANANTRAMTSAEISQQAEQVEKLLYKLQEEGYEFPGRMRDHVAKAVQVSTSKLARLKVIRENLAEECQPAFQSGKLNESTAYELAKMPVEWQRIFWGANIKDFRHFYTEDVKMKSAAFQRISEMECSQSHGLCENRANMIRKIAGAGAYSTPCTGCCLECVYLKTCGAACRYAYGKKQELKAQAKAEKQAEEAEKEKKNRPAIEYIQGVYSRIGQLRKKHGISVEQLYKAGKIFYGKSDEEKEKNLEAGNGISATDSLPFHYGFNTSNATALCAVADLLHCSTDYLLGRSSYPEQATPWHTGKPWNIGDYVVLVRYSPECSTCVATVHWDGISWWEDGTPLEDMGAEILLWTDMPEVE
ncbi:MAG TPA: ParB N-terminal domain-containing protein [Candidatus Faecousia faecavium]|nr:ParB N-terminal domain-containing protein [Candidatus Faecousia faecavium]